MISAMLMRFSILLLMAQKNAVEQLMNLAALWTLNNFDNILLFIYELSLLKIEESRNFICSENFMKFKASDIEIKASIYWVYTQIAVMSLYYLCYTINQVEVCNDVENYLMDMVNWKPQSVSGQISTVLRKLTVACFIFTSFLPFLSVPLVRHLTERYYKKAEVNQVTDLNNND
jgi:hypothetical protein